eukprot:TRINITY_DN2032_c0_g1_i1.p1 TRINITY_DN2032_c0_g1~~TRINITY_DN2032_c0_g1_i1.p1  ORF type:complete len:491 (+),score=80.91 TRINITY_DN2032_c0_g1_i1:121-1593(+)
MGLASILTWATGILIGFGCIFAGLIFILRKRRIGKWPYDLKSSAQGATRKLGLLERWYAAHCPRPRIFHQTLLISGAPFDMNAIRAAVSRLVSDHPALACTTDQEQRNCIRLEDAHLKIVYAVHPRKNSTTHHEIAAQLSNSVFSPDLSPLKVTVVANEGEPTWELILSFNHIFADGASAIPLVRELLEHMEAFPKVRASVEPDDHPTIDNALDIRPTLLHILTAVLADKVPVALRPKPQFYAGPAQLPAEVQRYSGIPQPFHLNESDTSALLQQCRQHNTSVTAALVSALCFATAAPLPTAAPLLRWDSPVNLRTFCSPPIAENIVGVYLTSLFQDVRMQPKLAFWDLAQSVKKRLGEGIDKQYQMLGLLSFLSGSWAAFVKRSEDSAPNARHSSCGVSNLGSVEFKRQYGPWLLNGVIFSQGMHYTSPCFNCSTITVQGKLFGTVNFCEPMFGVADGRAVATNVQALLERVARGDSITFSTFVHSLKE